MDKWTALTVSIGCMSIAVAIAAIAFASQPKTCAETHAALVRHCTIGPFTDETNACLEHAKMIHASCAEAPSK